MQIYPKNYGDIHNIIYLDESSVQLCGKLLKYFDISSDSLDRYSDKLEMSRKLKDSEVKISRGTLFLDNEYINNSINYLQEIEKIIGNYPYFIKPRDLSGSRGVSLINNLEEFISWVEQKDNHSFLIQEYLDGKLFHCECFIKNYEILSSFVFEYSRPGFFFSKGFSVGSISLPLNHPLKKRISSFTKDVLQGLGIIKNGVTHVEVYLNKNDELIFLEAAARPPGLVGNLLYKKYLNISINEIHLLLQLEESQYPLHDFKVDYYSARCIFPFTKTGKIIKFMDKPDVGSALLENFVHNIGDDVKISENFFNAAGTTVLWNKNYDELRKDFLTLSNYNPYQVEPD